MNDEVEAGPMCTGDCDDDSDCDAGLLCYQRDFTFNTPPGCRPQVSANECENALNECDVVDKGATRTNLDSHPYSYVLDRAQIRVDVIVTTNVGLTSHPPEVGEEPQHHTDEKVHFFPVSLPIGNYL